MNIIATTQSVPAMTKNVRASRLASRRFGAAVGERVAAALADVRDGSRLEAAADLVFDCATEAQLLGQLDVKLA